MSLITSITNRLFGAEISRQVRSQMAEVDEFLVGSRNINGQDRDRASYDFQEILKQSLEAWRTNPLARRIVGLTSQYVVGAGLEFSCKHTKTQNFLRSCWANPRNNMKIRLYEWCDELTRSGNLIIIMSTDQAGMSYFRALPVEIVEKIETRPNDPESELAIITKQDLEGNQETYAIYDPVNDGININNGRLETVAFHFAINRPIGAQFGEPDLAPVLKWLARYSNWLEDRARLNRFRTAFLYIVTGKYTSDADRMARQNQLMANPPNPGSILVTDENEKWEVLGSKIEAGDAAGDGLAIKKMIAGGMGIPLHFLAEPESATRTTAEAAGGPTYRHFEQRQEYFENIMQILLKAAAERRQVYDPRVKPAIEITIAGADISSRDNISLAMAASNMVGTLKDMRDRKLIDDTEFLRLMYRFFGETVDLEAMLERGRNAPEPTLIGESKPTQPESWTASKNPEMKKDVKINPETGEENGS